MTPQLHAMLHEWLAGDDEAHRRHAEHRLSLPDAVGYVPPLPPPPTIPTPRAGDAVPLVPLADSLRAQKYGGLKCGHASPDPGCGCSGFKCALLGRSHVTLGDCVPCLKRRFLAPDIKATEFITTARLTRDTLTLIESLPPTIDAVVAIARSGLMPGSVAAVHLHLPLYSVTRETGVVDVGGGFRTRVQEKGEPRHVLLIDDTVGLGQEMRACTPLVMARFPAAAITRAAVYCNPEHHHLVDYAYAFYPGRHFLEWCSYNNGLGQTAMTDFDGVLCEECPEGSDDDGPRYLEFLANARPHYLPRRPPLLSIVTARHEKYREPTMRWLDRHRVAIAAMTMRDWDYYPHVSHDEQVGAWKAEICRASGQSFMFESSPVQAEIICRLTGLTVICPPAERVYHPGATA